MSSVSALKPAATGVLVENRDEPSCSAPTTNSVKMLLKIQFDPVRRNSSSSFSTSEGLLEVVEGVVRAVVAQVVAGRAMAAPETDPYCQPADLSQTAQPTAGWRPAELAGTSPE